MTRREPDVMENKGLQQTEITFKFQNIRGFDSPRLHPSTLFRLIHSENQIRLEEAY